LHLPTPPIPRPRPTSPTPETPETSDASGQRRPAVLSALRKPAAVWLLPRVTYPVVPAEQGSVRVDEGQRPSTDLDPGGRRHHLVVRDVGAADHRLAALPDPQPAVRSHSVANSEAIAPV